MNQKFLIRDKHSMGVSYRVSARYVSRYIFCIFSLYLGTMYLYPKSIARNALPIRYFFHDLDIYYTCFDGKKDAKL